MRVTIHLPGPDEPGYLRRVGDLLEARTRLQENHPHAAEQVARVLLPYASSAGSSEETFGMLTQLEPEQFDGIVLEFLLFDR